MKLIIVRGLDDAETSTWVKGHAQPHGSAEHLSPHMFFNGAPESPEWEFTAYSWCYFNTVRQLTCGADVAVSGKFSKICQIEPYMIIAGKLLCAVEIVEFPPPQDQSTCWEVLPEHWQHLTRLNQ